MTADIISDNESVGKSSNPHGKALEELNSFLEMTSTTSLPHGWQSLQREWVEEFWKLLT